MEKVRKEVLKENSDVWKKIMEKDHIYLKKEKLTYNCL